jgi:hypothetical protein
MNDLYGTILNLSPRAQTIIAFFIGFILIDDLTADQQIAIGNLFVLAGQALITDGAEQRIVEIAKAEAEQRQLSGNISNLQDRVKNIEDLMK